MMFINRSNRSNDTHLNNFSSLRLLSAFALSSFISMRSLFLPWYLLVQFESMLSISTSRLFFRIDVSKWSVFFVFAHHKKKPKYHHSVVVFFGDLRCFVQWLISLSLWIFVFHSFQRKKLVDDRVFIFKSMNGHRSRTWSMWEKEWFFFSLSLSSFYLALVASCVYHFRSRILWSCFRMTLLVCAQFFIRS